MDRSSPHFARRGGFADVLKIAFPLIVSQSCHALNMFTDRLMLARFSQAAIAASFTGGLTIFTISCFFVGMTGYTGTFIAQYEGAGLRDRIGRTLWQGIYLALIGGALLATGVWWLKPLFESFGHEENIVVEEVRYASILSGGAFIFLLSCVLPTFWSGRGKTLFVLAVSFVITLCNIPFNYILIFGKCGFPAGGSAGAAVATILSETVGVAIYAVAFFLPRTRRMFHTTDCAPDLGLAARIVRFGAPNGVNLFVDLVSFSTFCIVLGGYGGAVHEATGIAFGINSLAFCPLIGIAMTASILVGQSIGAGNIPLARRSVRSCLILAAVYNVMMIVLFTLFQDSVLAPFVRSGDPAQRETLALAGEMLYFISAYLFFDGFSQVFSNALRGAGDTRFTMYAMMIVGIALLALPCVLLFRAGAPWWSLWLVIIGCIILWSAIFGIRYRKGKWTKMRVIEEPENRPDDPA
ncbi:MAG: MATE family efflux transporter [Victivallaceae bacterium]|nr:MATE family efflux transporter [Victivallaceae bacterium]